MVDRTDLQQASMLYAELNMIDSALKAFDNGGVIISMEVSQGPLPDQSENVSPFSLIGSGVRIPIVGVDYPPQMADEMKTLLQQREDEIASELSSLGVTGVEVQARGAVGSSRNPPQPRGAVGATGPPRKPAPSKRK